MSKKAFKVASAAAVAASAFVAVNPAQAATAAEADVLVKKAESLGGTLKWAISVEGSWDGHSNPDMKLFNDTKAAHAKAVTAVSSLPAGSQKTALQTRLNDKVKLYVDRAVTVIDAVSAGKKIEGKKMALETQLDASKIDSATVKAYDDLSAEIRKQESLLSRVYGQTSRASIRDYYQKSAEAVKAEAKYPVSVLVELGRLDAAITAKNLTEATTRYTNISDWLPKVENATMKAELQAQFDAKKSAYEALKAPKIESVSAINGTKLEVKFNRAIDSNTISIGDFTVTGLDSQGALVGLVGTLSADGKTYTIETAGGQYFTKRYDVKLADKVIKSTDGKDVAEYKTTISVSDTAAPSITSISASPAGSGLVDVTVKFSEQMASVGTVSVNGSVVSPTFAPNSKSMTITGLTAGSTYRVDVLGASDVAGNVANPLTTSISTSTDSAAPSVNVSVTNATVKLDFSEEVAGSFDVKVNGAGTFTAVQNGNDPTIYTVDVSSALGTSTFLNNAKIDVTGIVDLAGNAGQNVTVYSNIVKDTTAPKFVSASAEGAKLVLKYDEAIDSATAANITDADLGIKLVDKDGVQHTLAAATDFTATTAHGLDLNGNGITDAGTEEEKYVVVTLAEAVGGKDFIDAAGKLVQGTYSVTVAKDQLTDATGNFVAASSFNVVVGAGSVAKTVTYTANNTGLAKNQFKVVYSEAMSNDALLASKYTLGGATLPAGTTLTFVDSKQNVLITLPEAYISVSGPRFVEVTGVTAVDGDLQDAANQLAVSVTFTENVAPTATKLSIVNDAQAVVDFSEAVTGATTGIKVKLNGVEVTPTSLSNTGGDLQVNFAAGTLKLTDKVTVEFSGSVLADAATNKVKDGSISN